MSFPNAAYSGTHPSNLAAALEEIAGRQLSDRDAEYLRTAAADVRRLAGALEEAIR